jgi:hypothetical protein
LSVSLRDRLGRRLGLGPVDVRLPVDDLALQVRLVDDVVVDDAERPDTRGRQVEQRGAAEASGADDQDLGVLETLLAGHADVRDDQVTAVSTDLVDRELVGGFDKRGDHGNSLMDGCLVPTARTPPYPDETVQMVERGTRPPPRATGGMGRPG